MRVLDPIQIQMPSQFSLQIQSDRPRNRLMQFREQAKIMTKNDITACLYELWLWSKDKGSILFINLVMTRDDWKNDLQ